MHRFLFKPALVFLLVSGMPATNVLAQSSANKAKGSEARTIPIKRAFQFYDLYTSLPPQDRDGFRLSYKLKAAPGSPRPQLSYVLANARTPIELAPDGTVLNMPSAALYANGNIDVPAGQGRLSIGLDLHPIIPLGPSIAVTSVSNALNDYRAALRRAGPLAAFAPKLESIRFVGGSNGQAVFGDGRRVALPTAPEGGFLFKPTAPVNRGVTALSFASSPNLVAFAK